ncbi:MAG: DMT family transporter [Lentisphaeraceae bacterium]|nr:DMT family transporter [Lentisphaeraceae bacterium]
MFYLMFGYISAIWGSSFILMKRAELSYPSLSLATYRLIGASLILFVFWAFGKRQNPFKKKELPSLLFMSFCTILPYAAQPYLIAKYGSAFIGMMVIFVPLLTILVSLPMLRLSPSKRQFIGVIGGLAFAWLIVKDGVDRELTIVDGLLAFSIPFFYALGNTYTKKHLTHMKPLDLSLAIMVLSALILWPVATYLEDVKVNEHFQSATIYLGVLGTLGTGIPVIFFFYLIANRGPLFAGMVTYVIPLGAIFWGVFDGEKITLLQLIAMTGLLIMVGLVQWPVKAKPVIK